MKQLSKTGKVLERLQASYGREADLTHLAVFEFIALNTAPVRKSSGLFQGARNSLSLLSEMAAFVQKESIPLQLQHDTTTVPYGRVFWGEAIGDELRVLLAIDGKNHPDIVEKVDNGTLDQVSVGFQMKSLRCSKCSFDYMSEEASWENLWDETCPDGHTIGRDGTHLFVDGLALWYELSLVGMGAAVGAKVISPSEARLSDNEQFRLAASAAPKGKPFALQLTPSPTVKDTNTMNSEQMAAFQAAVSGQATAQAELAVRTSELSAANDRVTALTAELAAANEAREAAVATAAEAATHRANYESAVAALTDEVNAVLTALGLKDVTVPTDIPGLQAMLKEHRGKFAAVIPPNGVSTEATGDTHKNAPARANAAFRAPPAR